MAHLVDGVVSVPVLVGGSAIAVAAIGYGLRRIEGERIAHVGVMSAAFFVASLVHVPIGPASAHLLLNGLAGIVLGWAAVPAIFAALMLQAAFFGFGGITVLGVNTVIMALPAVAAFYLFAGGAGHRFARAGGRASGFVSGAAAGAFAVCASCGLIAGVLMLSGAGFAAAAKLIFAAHLPIAIVEAFVTGCAVVFLRRVKPDVLALGLAPQAL